MNIRPDPDAIPLVFRYTKCTKADAFRFTTAASYMSNAELIASDVLKVVWRVGYSADEEARAYHDCLPRNNIDIATNAG